MRQLESLDAWRAAQDLAERAYLLTVQPALARHFALVDQIRRAAISIPASISEGYALGTTTQFVRYLRISLGSAAELGSHLEILRRLKLIEEPDVSEAAALCTRVISMLIGLLRKLGRRSTSPIPFPASRIPVKSHAPESSS
ncbi:MAG TPA: four helix bundle protein [Gemmatimonadales bacterium]|nr:four helix bundle protein [Gemmatimonadales bacterium]